MKEGLRLRNAILGSGNTITQASDKIGLTRQMLANYFKREKLPADLLDKVKSKLGVDLETPGTYINSEDKDLIREIEWLKEKVSLLEAQLADKNDIINLLKKKE